MPASRYGGIVVIIDMGRKQPEASGRVQSEQDQTAQGHVSRGVGRGREEPLTKRRGLGKETGVTKMASLYMGPGDSVTGWN